MYEKLASLSRRIDDIDDNVEIAMKTRSDLWEERVLLLSEDTWEIGVHDVFGGHVAVIETDRGLYVQFFQNPSE